jgi:hypothetical protein
MVYKNINKKTRKKDILIYFQQKYFKKISSQGEKISQGCTY